MNKRIRENNNEHLNTTNKSAKTVTEFNYDDILKEYSKLKKYPHEITPEIMFEQFPLYPDVKNIFKSHEKSNTIGLLGLVFLDSLNENQKVPCYSTTYNNTTDCIKNNEYVFQMNNMGDAIFDIEVYNASYATIVCSDIHIDMFMDKNKFILPQCTYDNPIFICAGMLSIYVLTDGNKISYNNVWANRRCFNIGKILNM